MRLLCFWPELYSLIIIALLSLKMCSHAWTIFYLLLLIFINTAHIINYLIPLCKIKKSQILNDLPSGCGLKQKNQMFCRSPHLHDISITPWAWSGPIAFSDRAGAERCQFPGIVLAWPAYPHQQSQWSKSPQFSHAGERSMVR